MTDTGRWDAKPNRLPWPPVLYAIAALAGFACGRFVPIAGGWWTEPWAKAVGGLMMATGLGLDLATMVWMYRQRANILPHRAATALVTTGPFAVSRNPIYLGNTLLVAGAAPVLHNPWFLPAALIAAFAVTQLAIRREEAHLAVRFGSQWRDYANRTPRWLIGRG